MKQEIKTKTKKKAIMDCPRYECSEMSARFAITWLDGAYRSLKQIKQRERSYNHDGIIKKIDHCCQELLCLVIEIGRAYRGNVKK